MTYIFLTAHLIFSVEFYCAENHFLIEEDCRNEIVQCLGDDVFTLSECVEQYKEDVK